MHSQMRIVKHGEEITLVSSNGGQAMFRLAILEIVLLGALVAHLGTVVAQAQDLALPVAASLALIAWTAMQVRPDYRISMNLASRRGRVVRISALTGRRFAAELALDDVEGMALRQKASWASWNEYVVAVELRSGDRHVLSTRGHLLAYMENVARFSSATGINSRIVRLSAA